MPTSTSQSDLRLMLRALLFDRFQMAVHTRSEERNGFALVVGPKGTAMRPALNGDPLPPMPETGPQIPVEIAEGRLLSTLEGKGIAALTGRRVPMSRLTDGLSQWLQAPVDDRTGLRGDYYFHVLFARPDMQDADVLAPTIPTAVQETLGLRLERVRTTADLLVVDRLDINPTPN